MRVRLSSNVFTTTYIILFDILLPILLAWIVKVLLSSYNRKIIYKDRKPLCLSQTRLAIFVDQGLSERLLVRMAALTCSVIVILCTLGSFSINGGSTDIIGAKTVPYAVVAAGPGEAIDYTKHFSRDGQLVSGTFLAVFERQHCFAHVGQYTFHYSSVLDLQFDITSIDKDRYDYLYNSTCRVEANGFVDTVTIEDFVLDENIDISNCSLIVHWSPVNDAPASKARADMKGSSCPLEFVEAWCSKTVPHTACVALVKHLKGFNTIHFYYPKDFPQAENGGLSVNVTNFFVLGYFMKNKMESKMVKSMAYLMSLYSNSHYGSRTIARHTLKKNVQVNVIAGKEKETEISVLFLIMTCGIGLILACLVLLASSIIWFQTSRGAGTKNSFYSAGEALAYSKL